jgi:hypothetical protein
MCPQSLSLSRSFSRFLALFFFSRQVDVDLAARTVVARVIDAQGRAVLERQWAMDEINLSKLQMPMGLREDGASFAWANRTYATFNDTTTNNNKDSETKVVCVPHRGEASRFVQALGYAFALVVFLLPLLAFALQLASLPTKLRQLQSWAAQKEPLGLELLKLQSCASEWAARAPGLKLRRRFGSWALRESSTGKKLKKLRSWASSKGPVEFKLRKLEEPGSKLRKLANTREVQKLRGGLRRALEKASSAQGRISAGL